jgi:hypothetical protein
MAAILGIVIVLGLALFFFHFRSMGRMGQQPSAGERMKHNGTQVRKQGPRASGLNESVKIREDEFSDCPVSGQSAVPPA